MKTKQPAPKRRPKHTTGSPEACQQRHCSPDFTALGIPVVPLDTKLEYLRNCIVDGHYADAMGHLDDLRDSIHLRACLIGMNHSDLTSDGIKSLRFTEANAPGLAQAAQDSIQHDK